MMFLGCVHGLLYIKMRITQIEMQKDLMAININSNQLVDIPHELRITVYPRSFQFYDFIIGHMKRNISDQLHDIFNSELKYRFEFTQRETISSKIN